MSYSEPKTLWYKSHNYIWIENLRDQDGTTIETATIDGTIFDTNGNKLDTVSFSHDTNGNYVGKLSSTADTVNLDYGSNVTMDLNVDYNGEKHFMKLIFTIDVDRA